LITISRLIDLTGKKFGKLLVLSRNKEIKAKNKQSHWNCICDCGNTVVVNSSNLVRGHTSSCGCIKVEAITKHGMHNSPEYRAYQSMLDRCYNPNNGEYENYGGRGISVCEAWRDSFVNFFTDMGNKPSPNLSLDRIDVNGDYSPENCRWTDIYTQARNRTIRKENKTGVPGIEYRSGSYRVKITAYGKVYNLGTYHSLDAAAEARRKGEELYWKTGVRA